MYDGVNILRWNFKIKPFVIQRIIQTKKDTHKLRTIEDHMSLSGVIGKARCYCQLMLRLQKGKDVDQP
jgi:transketolase C-terminal domain/subunit